MTLDDITIVLARPSEPGNVGAVCRAMKNSGLGRLRIAAAEKPDGALPGMGIPDKAETAAVLPEDIPVEAASLEARLPLKKLLDRAIHAGDIWNAAEHFVNLKDALADCAITVGTSRRRGRHRKSNSLTPHELVDFLKTKTGRTAIVFGNERTGLEREELELCNMASHIPVSPEFPSLNLSHAVQIYAYELYQAFADAGTEGAEGGIAGNTGGFTGPAPVPGQWVPMNAAEIETFVQDITDSLKSLGFYQNPGREEQERFLRDLAARAGLSLNEGRYLGSIIAKAGRLGQK